MGGDGVGVGWGWGEERSKTAGSALGGAIFGTDQILAHPVNIGWANPNIIWGVAILSDPSLSILGQGYG